MASEEALREASARGARAKALLENELLQEFFTRTEAELIKIWRDTDTADTQPREDAWRSLKLLDNLKNTLTKCVTVGDVSAKELLKMKAPSLLKKVISR